MYKSLYLLAIAFSLFACQKTDYASSSANNPPDLEAFIGKIVSKKMASGQVAGLSVGVSKDGKTIFKQAYGKADLEFEVPTPLDANYEIGSITKQFTAAAILQLVEQGKLSLEDNINTYFPDFDYQSHTITVLNLLDHTSGVKSYTEMESFGNIFRQSLPRDTLVRLVSEAGFDFAPGEAMIYNNSAYFMLGLIIEQVAEMSYEEYLDQYLFAPAGMENSYYCSESKVIHHRAHGYQPDGEGQLHRAAYLNHLWPYAAGSICSTIDDLLAWNQALHVDGKILTDEMYQRMITPSMLKDGTPLRYAMGVIVADMGGYKTIQHGGGIFGFVSDGRFFPEENLTIITLMNTSGPVSTAEISMRVARKFLDFQEASPIFNKMDITPLTGTYTGIERGREIQIQVSVENNGLTFVKNGHDERMIYRGNYQWEQDNGRAFRSFARFIQTGISFDELRWDEGTGHYILKRTN